MRSAELQALKSRRRRNCCGSRSTKEGTGARIQGATDMHRRTAALIRGRARGHGTVMLPIATAACRQLLALIRCKQRRQQREAEQRDKQQCERTAHRQISSMTPNGCGTAEVAITTLSCDDAIPGPLRVCEECLT